MKTNAIRTMHRLRVFVVVIAATSAVFLAVAQDVAGSGGASMDQLLKTYLSARSEQLGRLLMAYERALTTQFDRAADAGDLPLATAFKRESDDLTALKVVLASPVVDPVATAKKPADFPTLPADAPEALVKLRKTWTTECVRIDAALKDSLIRELQALESELTKARDLAGAQAVLALRTEFQGKRGNAAGDTAAPSSPIAIANVSAGKTTDRPKEATRDVPFENGLKMRFIPVEIVGGPTAGKKVLFSIWETRVSDYANYAKRNRKPDPSWQNLTVSGYHQEENHPVAAVNWDDAKGFCEWLTETERRMRQIGPEDRYRLPSDHEWSCAAGIGDQEDPNASPIAKRNLLQQRFWWGTEWPPTAVYGNFCGEDATFRVPVPGYRDGFPFTAPVGSFPTDNIGGLFDLAGNAAEWCEDLLDPAVQGKRSLRGGSWARSTPDRYAICNRYHDMNATDRQPDFGFRCVLEVF